VDLEGAKQGYAISLYVKVLGADREGAMEEWGGALEAVVGLIRSRDFRR
jgi:hypothetical protein